MCRFSVLQTYSNNKKSQPLRIGFFNLIGAAILVQNRSFRNSSIHLHFSENVLIVECLALVFSLFAHYDDEFKERR